MLSRLEASNGQGWRGQVQPQELPFPLPAEGREVLDGSVVFQLASVSSLHAVVYLRPLSAGVQLVRSFP